MYREDRYDEDFCPDCGNENAACDTAEIKEFLEVCVPVTVDPDVEVGDVIVSTIDEPCVRPIPCGHWNRNGLCKFIVTQKLCVQFPITFKARAIPDNGLSTDCCDKNHRKCCKEHHY